MRTRAPLLVAATLFVTGARAEAQNPDAPTPVQLANTPPALLARLDAERSSGLLYWTGKRFEIYSTHD